jgi:DNA polymerase III subunit epsilon
MVMKRLLQWLWPEKHPVLLWNEEFFSGFRRDRPIESYDFVSMDTELTGLNPRGDEIVSIGAVRIRNLRIVVGDNFFSYVRPSGRLPKDSTLVHRITPEQIKTAPDLNEVLPAFIEFLGPSLIVGHFITLDLDFINRASRRLLGGRIQNRWLDTIKLARGYEETQRHEFYDGVNPGAAYGLTHLAEKYNLPLFAKHDALEDALQTAYLFLFLVRRLRAAGSLTLEDFLLAGGTFPY